MPTSPDDTPTSQHAPTSGSPGARARSADHTIGPNDAIGPYKLLSVLGEGGFGIVYAAERREPFVQRVAIKVLKPGMDSRAVIARFEQERQALAVMDHPNVARVLDGGLTDPACPLGANLPYFVMEYVQGESITSYAAKRQLSLRDKLELFLPVCDAVQHAHMKGIVHRDLKPSNILVANVDAIPVPKVIDFGIAKAIRGSGPSLSDVTIVTERGQFIGTPEYMSPEQADGKSDVDTRTDVYSLGVILYQLLTGELPFSSADFRAAGLAEILRIIKEVEPPKPSTRLSAVLRAGTDTSATTLAPRTPIQTLGSSPTAVVRALRGDLDWIVMRALEKSRNRRYESPSSLSADIRRYLRTEPVEAGPPSASYRLTKFVRRHKLLVAAAAISAAGLLIGLGVATMALREAQKERDAALTAQSAERAAKELAQAAREAERQQRIRAEAASEFIWSTLAVNNPWLEPSEMTVQELLALIDERQQSGSLSDDPELDLEVRYQIAALYSSLGRPQLVVERLEPLLPKAPVDPNAPSPRAVNFRVILATALNSMNRSQDALRILDEIRTVTVKPPAGRDGAPAGMVLFQYARAYLQLGKREEAEAAFKQSVDVFEDAGPRFAEEASSGLAGLSVLYSRWAGREKDAIAPAQQAVDIRRAAGEPNSPLVQNALNILGRAYEVNGRFEDAIASYSAAVSAHQSRGGRPTEELAAVQSNLAFILRDLSRPDEAMTYLQQALATRKALDPNSVGVADLLDLLATMRTDAGGEDNLRSAIDLYKQELAIVDRPDPAMGPLIARCLTGLSITYLKLNQPENAIEISRRAFDLRSKLLAKGDWRIESSKSVHAAALAALGRFDEAEPLMLEAARAAQANRTLAPLKRAAVIQRAVDMYTAWNKPEKAAEWSRLLPPDASSQSP